MMFIWFLIVSLHLGNERGDYGKAPRVPLNDGNFIPALGLGTSLAFDQTQRGVVPIPKAFSLDQLKENIDIFDFKLTNEEMSFLNTYNVNYRTVLPMLWLDHPHYPFKADENQDQTYYPSEIDGNQEHTHTPFVTAANQSSYLFEPQVNQDPFETNANPTEGLLDESL